jgi:putative transposase
MPWKARLDTPGALHHIVVGGIERHNIFYDDNCLGDCLERLGAILVQGRTACYAWAVMPKDLRLMLLPGRSSILTRKRLILAGVK